MTEAQRACDVENAQDFNRYYHNGWVGWHPTDAEHVQPIFMTGGMGFDTTGPTQKETLTARFLRKGLKGELILDAPTSVTWENLKSHIDFGIPDIGMFQDGPTILFGAYMCPRVAKKGFRPRDLQLTDFNGWAIRKKYTTQQSMSSNSNLAVWQAFNPEYSSLERALEQMASGEKVGVVLTRTLGLYALPKVSVPLLAYKRWTVGCVLSPYLIHLKREYGDYEETIARQTGAEVILV